MIQYQGRLTDDAGVPLDTTVNLTFIIYEDSVAGSILWVEVHSNVVITDGLFTVKLGSYMNLNETVINGTQRWLGVAVGDGDPLTPRTPIVSTAYALKSQKADTASFATQANHAKQADTASYASKAKKADTATVALNVTGNGWVDAGNEVYLSTIGDSVGIGTINPRAPLEVQGPMHAIIGESHGSGTAAGVFGGNDATGFGVMGVSNNGRGVTGLSVTGFGGHFYGPKNYFSSNLGIGTEAPAEMLHIYKNSSGAAARIRLQSAHATNWGEVALQFENPISQWRFFMDDATGNNLYLDALGLYNENLGEFATIWREDGRVGIGSVSSNHRFTVMATGHAILGYSTGTGAGVYGYSESGYGGYFSGPKHYFSNLTGFGTTSPTHRVTVNGEMALQKNGVTKYHLNYYNTGFNICETNVADYRLYIKDGGNVGIGTSNPTTKLYVAGTFHANTFEDNIMDKDNIVDEPGVANTESTSYTNLTTSWQNLLSRSISTPGTGYVLAIATAWVRLDHGITGNSRANLGISTISNSMSSSYYYDFQLPAGADAGLYVTPVTTHRLFSVNKGTYTYYFVGRYDLDNPGTVATREMTLVYIPSAYGTVTKAAELGEESDLDQGEGSIVPVQDNIDMVMSGESSDLEGRLNDVLAEMEALKQRLAELENK